MKALNPESPAEWALALVVVIPVAAVLAVAIMAWVTFCFSPFLALGWVVMNLL